MTMAWVGAGIALLGVAVSGTSMYMAGENAEDVADFNAEMTKRSADDALERGAIEAADKRQQTRQLIARQHALQAASGFDTSQGTAADLMTETAGLGELDALKILNNAQRQASGMKVAADLESAKGDAASRAGAMNAVGTGLSGAATAAYYGKGLMTQKTPATS